MRLYDFFTIGELDEYGQQTISPDIQGQIKIAINTTSQSVQDNINYKSANYIGLTLDTKVNDTYIIKKDNELLKVLYVQPKGRYKQVFMVLQ